MDNSFLANVCPDSLHMTPEDFENEPKVDIRFHDPILDRFFRYIIAL